MNSYQQWCFDFEMNQKQQMRQLIQSNQSIYSNTDEISTFTIPCTAIRGRAGNSSIYTGYINLDTGYIRLDSDNPEFWMEIHVGEINGVTIVPGCMGAKNPEHAFNPHVKTDSKKRKCASSE